MRHVDAGQVEFGYELIAALPHAYHLHKHGLLSGTTSGHDTRPLYYFSPKHTIDQTPRAWGNMHRAQPLPNIRIHRDRLNLREWTPPPLRAHYAKRAITWKKPTVVICNRYNEEWGRPPVNFLPLDVLDVLFRMLTPKYQVVYLNNYGMPPQFEDSARSMDLGDYAWIRKRHRRVVIFHDLLTGPGAASYNETQLRVFAGCQRFITMNGGLGILASYFGGENIIYSKECRELDPRVNSFHNWYHLFGGSYVKHVRSHDALLAMVRAKWVDEQPLINIVLRCHRRPDELQRFWKSLKVQTHLNWHVVAGYHSEGTWSYLCQYPFEKYPLSPPTAVVADRAERDYGAAFPPNLLLNELAGKVRAGYVHFMDDDDWYTGKDALSTVAAHLAPSRLTMWRVDCGGRTIPAPSNKTWQLVPGDVSGIGFAYHHQHQKLAQWEPWRRGDFRVICNLAAKLKVNTIDRTLCGIGK